LAVKQRVATGYVLLEESMTEMLDRTFAHLGILDSQDLAKGRLQPHDFTTVHDVASQLHDAPLYVYDGPAQTWHDVRSQIRRMVGMHGCKVVFLDYLQLIEAPGDNLRTQMVTVSKGLKNLAKELDVPIVVTAQLHREAENRPPRLSDFAESSQIEKDANVAILIDRQEKDGEEQHSLVIAKNKDGPRKVIRVWFRKAIMTFGEIESDA
jgi:replicative DNA helicase